MEPLVEIPREEWPALRAMYAAKWPDGAEAYCILNMHLIKPNLKEAFSFKVYCPEGRLTNGMIGVSLRKDYFQIMIQPIGEDTTKIEEALLTTKLIDWNRNIMVPFANNATIQCLEKIKSQLGINVYYGKNTIAFKHILRNDSKKFGDIRLPPNTYIGPLKPKHLEIVDKTWTFNSDKSYKFFETLMRNDMTYVLYSSEGDSSEPLAWVTVGEHGALTHLYCLEEHRRKGYSELVTKYAANELLDKDQHVLAFTVDGNERAQSLFRKLGFKDYGYDYWVVVNKTNEKKETE